MDIHVKRYSDPNSIWESSVEAEDRSWILFVPRNMNEATPQLWLRTVVADEHGAITHTFVPAGKEPKNPQ